jgi:hypothetical protein
LRAATAASAVAGGAWAFRTRQATAAPASMTTTTAVEYAASRVRARRRSAGVGPVARGPGGRRPTRHSAGWPNASAKSCTDAKRSAGALASAR